MSRHGILDPSFPHEMFQVQREALRQLIEHIDEFPELHNLDRSRDRYLVNYVTALLGQRGAGKTTVMHELRKEILANFLKRRWLVTEILVPDVLHSRDSIGPAIFDVVFQALFSAAGVDQAKQLFVEDNLGELRSNLSWFYNPFVPNDIIARDSVSASNFARSVFEYHIKAKNLHVEFAHAIEACVHELEVNKIIVMIDDADININLVGRILDVIRYALSSPRVVTVFSSDYATLRRRLFNERLENLHIDKLPANEVSFFGTTGEAFKGREVEAERDYVDAYLAKILPPSTRVTLQPTNASDLLHHAIRLGGADNTQTTISSLLDTVNLRFAATSESVPLSALVARYPSVLEVNLRGLVNQASQISYIVDKYNSNDFSFFGLKSDGGDVHLSGGLLQLNATLSEIDEAVIVRLLRLFFSSPIHTGWLESLSYFGILDLDRERSLSKILEAIVSRAKIAGSAIDCFIFQTSDSTNNVIQYKRKSEAHPIHLIVDLAVILGADLESVLRTLSFSHTEGFRQLYLSNNMFDFFRKHPETLVCNSTMISGSSTTGIAGLMVPGKGRQLTSPIFVRTSGEAATYTHRTMTEQTWRYVNETNDAFQQTLTKDTSDNKNEDTARTHTLDAEIRQLYFILFIMMDSCVDQLTSAYGAVFEVPATIVVAPELSFTSNPSFNWRIIRSLNGWPFLRRTLSVQGTGEACRWDKPLLVLLHLSQMTYKPMIACFDAANSAAREDRESVRDLTDELYSFLRECEFVNEARQWQTDEQFRQSVLKCGKLPRLAAAVSYWPSADWSKRGQALLDFFDYINTDGIDLSPDSNLQSSPPNLWKEHVDSFIHFRNSLPSNESVGKVEY